ncbi:hypothetical protein [Nakamurella lactea]|uniref:hypothetical protein n=1 Tax=Nakamurella lactea TaxID=459515 RepID=UPI0003FD64CE|nr:hypothetical protein [Nakamurella lactea]
MTTEYQLPLLRHGLVYEQGWTDYDIGRMKATGDWQLLRQGVYIPTGVKVFPEQRHRWLVEGTVARLRSRSDAVVSHVSAAVLHGLPVWGLGLDRVHITRPGRAGVNGTGCVHPHRAKLTDAEITMVDGIAVTSAARTVLDLARSAPFTQAVVVADGALAAELTTPDELAAVLEIARSRGSARAAARVIEFADCRSESVGESRSRVLFAVHGLPKPELQVRLHDRNGLFIGRVDFDLPEFRTVGEFDGFGKYSTLLRPGQSPADAVIEEKIREDRIRDTGRQVVRWTGRDLPNPGSIMQRFVAAFARSGFPDWVPSAPRLLLGRQVA